MSSTTPPDLLIYTWIEIINTFVLKFSMNAILIFFNIYRPLTCMNSLFYNFFFIHVLRERWTLKIAFKYLWYFQKKFFKEGFCMNFNKYLKKQFNKPKNNSKHLFSFLNTPCIPIFKMFSPFYFQFITWNYFIKAIVQHSVFIPNDSYLKNNY